MREENMIEEKKVSGSVKTIVAILITVITYSVTFGVFYANMNSSIEGKADRGEFEKYKAVDSVNTVNIFKSLEDIKNENKNMNDKFDKLLEKNNIRVPRNAEDNGNNN